MPVLQWSPAQIPEELRKYAKPCSACSGVRQKLLDLVQADQSLIYLVTLTYNNEAFSSNFVEVNCQLCKNTGWEMESALTKFLERVRAFLDGAAPHVPPVQVDEDILEVTPDDVQPAE